MLSVLSSSPSNQQSDVYVDANIEVTFSHEVHTSSLHADNIRIYTMPGYTGQIPIKSMTTNGPVVTIVPEYNFPANTAYQMWIRGDDNTDDTDLKGVVSIISETMDGHVTINFEVGSKKAADDNPINEIIVTAETLEDIDAVPSEILESNDFLDVIGTFPNDGDTNMSGMTDIVFKFDQELQSVDLTGGVINAMSGLVNITAEPLIFGNDPVLPEILNSEVEIQNNMLVFRVQDVDFDINTTYRFTLYKDKIIGTKQEKLPEDFELEFTTKLVPMYANVNGVRAAGGRMVPPSIPSSVIEKYIHAASIWVTAALERSTAYPEPIPYEIVQATIHKTICDIAENITMGELRYIRDKQLADLRIMYNNDNAAGAIDKHCDKAVSFLAKLNPNLGSRIGIKSGNTTYYPNAKRRVHNYGRRRTR